MTKWDKRLSDLEKQIKAKKGVPPEARGPHIVWLESSGEEADFSEIRADLMEKYGTIEGAEFQVISWGSPPPETDGESDGVDGNPI